MKREANAAARPVKGTRRRYTAQFRREIVEQTLVPGVSVAAIALEHRLNTNLLFKWRRDHLRQLAGAAKLPKMLPVIVEDVPLDGKPATRVAASVIEIELAAGRIRLKGAVDVESLRAVVDVLLRR
jgi:transposase